MLLGVCWKSLVWSGISKHEGYADHSNNCEVDLQRALWDGEGGKAASGLSVEPASYAVFPDPNLY